MTESWDTEWIIEGLMNPHRLPDGGWVVWSSFSWRGISYNLTRCIEHYLETIRKHPVANVPHRFRNIVTGEIIPVELIVE